MAARQVEVTTLHYLIDGFLMLRAIVKPRMKSMGKKNGQRRGYSHIVQWVLLQSACLGSGLDWLARGKAWWCPSAEKGNIGSCKHLLVLGALACNFCSFLPLGPGCGRRWPSFARQNVACPGVCCE